MTYKQYAKCKTSFKPIVLVVAESNWEAVKLHLLDDVSAACQDIVQAKPLIVEWDSGKGKFFPKSESFNQPHTDLKANDLMNNHTVILLSNTPVSWRIFQPFSHDSYFNTISMEFHRPACSAILYQDYGGPKWPWSYTGYSLKHEFGNAFSFIVDTSSAIPHVVKEILEKQSL